MILDPYPKTTHDSSGTSIFWPTSRVHHRSRQVTSTTSWLFVFTCPRLFLFLRTLLVLPESVSSKLQFLRPQINSFLNCSLCMVLGSTFHGIQWIGYRAAAPAPALVQPRIQGKPLRECAALQHLLRGPGLAGGCSSTQGSNLVEVLIYLFVLCCWLLFSRCRFVWSGEWLLSTYGKFTL